MATFLIVLTGAALAVTPRSLKTVSKREIPLYGDVFPSFAAALSPWAKYASGYSLGAWASPPKPLSPTPSEVAHAIAVAKQASANVVIAQQQVQAAKENVLNQQKTAMDKETAAALLTQKSEAAAAIQRSEAASAAQAVVLAQQRLAAAKASVAKQQQIASAKEAEAAAALQRAAHAAAEEIKRTGTCTTLGITIISREEWGARPPITRTVIPGKLPFVIIHHSESPGACFTTDDCKAKMRVMQDYHQLVKKWDDIGYSFAIGGDGNVYEGRGFNIVGAHAPGYNDKSIGICFIGNWNYTLPPTNMVQKSWELIDYGVAAGHIQANYTLYGHRQVRSTDCPGDTFFENIKKWPHFSHSVPFRY